jgi:hypothetical protein
LADGEAYAQFKAKQCYGLIKKLTEGVGPDNNVRVVPAGPSRPVVTCTQRRDSDGVLIASPAQLGANKALFADAGLHLRLPVFGDWMIIANGPLTLDQGVFLGQSGRPSEWARSGIVGASSIQLGRGPVPRKLTADESKELLLLADLVDKQDEVEGWVGFDLSLADLASDFLPGYVQRGITALGLVLGYRGATAASVSRALRRAANNYEPEPPPPPVDPEIDPSPRIAGVSKPRIAHLRPLRPGRGFSRRTARVLTELRSNRLQTVAYAEAFRRALDSGDAAAEKNKLRVERVQILAASRYARTIARLLVSDVKLRRQLAASLSGSLRNLRFTAADVRRVQRSIRKHGLPRAYLRFARRVGVDRGTLVLQRRRAVAISRRRAARSLRAILIDPKARAADLRAAKMFRLIARRLKQNPTKPVF